MTDKQKIQEWYDLWILSKSEFEHLNNGIEIINNL